MLVFQKKFPLKLQSQDLRISDSRPGRHRSSLWLSELPVDRPKRSQGGNRRKGKRGGDLVADVTRAVIWDVHMSECQSLSFAQCPISASCHSNPGRHQRCSDTGSLALAGPQPLQVFGGTRSREGARFCLAPSLSQVNNCLKGEMASVASVWDTAVQFAGTF